MASVVGEKSESAESWKTAKEFCLFLHHTDGNNLVCLTLVMIKLDEY